MTTRHPIPWWALPLLGVAALTAEIRGQAEITGRVVALDGSPMIGATILLGRQVDTGAIRFRYDSALTDDSGDFALTPEVFAQAPSGWFLEARKQEFRSVQFKSSRQSYGQAAPQAMGAVTMTRDSVPQGFAVLKITILGLEGISPTEGARVSVGCAMDVPTGSISQQPDFLITAPGSGGHGRPAVQHLRLVQMPLVGS